MQNVNVKLNSVLSCKSSIQQEAGSFHQQNGVIFREQTVKSIHLEYSFVWCCYLRASESRSEIPGKY